MFKEDMFKNKYTRIVLGAIWGFGLACIFRTACNNRNCIIYKAPNPAFIKNSVYGVDDKCYQYETKNSDCDETAIEI